MLHTRFVAAGCVAAALLAAPAAFAGDRFSISLAFPGVAVGYSNWGYGVAVAPTYVAPTYVAPAHYPPAPVVVAPPRVVYAPPAVVYRSYPRWHHPHHQHYQHHHPRVVYGPPVVAYRW